MVVYQDGCCAEVEKFLAQLEKTALAEGAISGPLVITRGIHCETGTSGDTHCPAGAADIGGTNIVNPDRLVWLGRNGGAGMFERQVLPGTWPWHIHFVLNGDNALIGGRKHNAGGAYQIGALNAGYNGLGTGGRAALDDGPREGVQWPLRTWSQGVTWLANYGGDGLMSAEGDKIIQMLSQIKEDLLIETGAGGALRGERTYQSFDQIDAALTEIKTQIAALSPATGPATLSDADVQRVAQAVIAEMKKAGN